MADTEAKFFAQMTLNHWVHMFHDIYHPTKNYERTEHQLFCRLVEQLSGIAKYAAKRPDQIALGDCLATAFSWIIAICQKCSETDLEATVWYKFPHCCAYCAKCPCSCQDTKPTPDSDILNTLRHSNANRKPRSLAEWQVMFREIYNSRNLDELSELLSTGFDQPQLFGADARNRDLFKLRLLVNLMHLVEELGELAKAMRLRSFNQDDFRDELADTFAWLMGAANLLAIHPQSSGFVLQDALWQRFPGQCHKCRQCPCRCATSPTEDFTDLARVLWAEHQDYMTGIASRNAWELLRSRSDSDPVAMRRIGKWALIVFDINDFKKVNLLPRTHQQGDEALSAVGQFLRSRFDDRRELPFRLGGDEFGILLFNADQTDAQRIEREVAQGIAALSIRRLDDENALVRITISTGSDSRDGPDGLSVAYAGAEEKQSASKKEYHKGDSK